MNSGSEANELALRLARAATGRPDVAIGRRRLPRQHPAASSRSARTSSTARAAPAGPRRPRRAAARTRTAVGIAASTPEIGCGLRRGPRRGARRRGRGRAARSGALIAEAPGIAGQIVPPPGWLAGAVRARAGGRRRADRRRGPGRVRSGRHGVVGVPARGRGPGHRHDGQADRQRPPARRGRHDPGDRRRLRQRHGVLQHVRRQPGLGRRSGWPSSTSSRTRASAPAPPRTARASSTASRSSRAATPRSATSAGRACSSASSSSRDRATREPDAELATRSSKAALARGVLLSTDGPGHDTLKIKPPLVIEAADIDRVVETLDALLGELASA